MKTKLIAITRPLTYINGTDLITGLESAEDLLVYTARVSNPSNQLNLDTGPRLLRYCIKHGHWSVFEQASMTVEIKTSRAIAAQILRHRSFCFQEFSQRYAVATESEPIELRSQDTKNRQGSGEVFDPEIPALQAKASDVISKTIDLSFLVYDQLIAAGVSKETARFVLPLSTQTTLYMTGSVRSWIHYFQQRCSDHAQKEHRLIALQIRDEIFKLEFPHTYEALYGSTD